MVRLLGVASRDVHGQLVIDLGSIPYYGIYQRLMLVVHIFHPIPRDHLLAFVPPPPRPLAMDYFCMLIHTALYHLITHKFHHLHTLLVFQYHQSHHSLS